MRKQWNGSRKQRRKVMTRPYYILGQCYEEGAGVDKDLLQAVRWYNKSANRGHSDARKALERLEQEGHVEVLIVRAKFGDAGSQYKLAVCYEEGKGVEQSFEEALKLYKAAASRGHEAAAAAFERLSPKVVDPDFGEIAYRGNCLWKGKLAAKFYGKKCELEVELEGSSVDTVSDAQRKAFAEYQEKKDAFFETMLQKAKQVYKGASGKRQNKILPQTLYIDRQGNYGWECVSAWNKRKISVILSDGDVRLAYEGVLYHYDEVKESGIVYVIPPKRMIK